MFYVIIIFEGGERLNFILDFCIVVILVLFVYFGYRRGFVRSILSCLSIFLSFSISNLLSTFLSKKIFEIFVRPAVFEKVSNILANDQILDPTQKIASIMDCCPKFLQGSFNNYLITGDAISDKFKLVNNAAAEQITDLLSPVFINFIHMIAMTVLIALCLFLFRFVRRALLKVFKAPGLKQINQLLGILFGFTKGILVVFVAIFFVRLALPISDKSESTVFSDSTINKTYIFKHVYHNAFFENVFKLRK